MKKILFVLFLFFLVLFFPLFVEAKEDVTLYFFHGDGCPHCREENKFLKKMSKKYSNLNIVKYEVWYNEENSALLDKVFDAYKINVSGVPTTIIGDTYISGYDDTIGDKIERAIEYYSSHKSDDYVSKISDGSFTQDDFPKKNGFLEQEKSYDKEMSFNLPFFGKINLKTASLTTAAVVIGLIDGFNPCAMWILLFLISVLMGMNNKKRMWILGITFLLTSALVYLGIMLSWIEIVVKITAIIWIRNIIAIVALIGGIINLRSFIKSNDSGCEVVDDKKRKKIFQKIRKFTSEKSFFLAIIGIVGLAISVNVVELACSAGLPIVFSELLVLNHTSSMMRFFYTILYVFFFLIDDLIVFFIAMFTMKVTGISTKYNKYSHLIGGVIMVLIGILLIVKPGWLMFQFK